MEHAGICGAYARSGDDAVGYMLMRTIPIAVVLLAALTARFAPAASLTALERQRLVAHLEMTESWLVDEVSGLSSGQLQFRPARGVGASWRCSTTWLLPNPSTGRTCKGP